MMIPRLLRMSDGVLFLVDPADDVRGWMVYASEGEPIGQVDDLLIDDRLNKVRLLQVNDRGAEDVRLFLPMSVVRKRKTREELVLLSGQKQMFRKNMYSRETVISRPVTAPRSPTWHAVFQHFQCPPCWEVLRTESASNSISSLVFKPPSLES